MDLLLLTADLDPNSVLPALDLLPVTMRSAAPEAASLVTSGPYDLVVLDARQDLAAARNLCRLLGSGGLDVCILAVVTDGGIVAIGPEWGVSDVVLAGAGPAEVHCRLRLLAGRSNPASNSGLISLGDLTIEEDTYTARLRGKVLELTYKEFELLKFLAQHPARVFTREQLVTEVWGYDFFGGTRTVDVHVRRLRAKLGAEHESLIGTVRNVGYKMVPPARSALREETAAPAHRMTALRADPPSASELAALVESCVAVDGVAPFGGHVLAAVGIGRGPALRDRRRGGPAGRPGDPDGARPRRTRRVPGAPWARSGRSTAARGPARAIPPCGPTGTCRPPGRWRSGTVSGSPASSSRCAGPRPTRLPAPELPAGVRIRAFVPGADDAAFLAVNARAFAWHPEQGRLDQAGLDREIAQDWFDAAGFLLAVDADDRLLGYHWTKVHRSDPTPADADADADAAGRPARGDLRAGGGSRVAGARSGHAAVAGGAAPPARSRHRRGDAVRRGRQRPRPAVVRATRVRALPDRRGLPALTRHPAGRRALCEDACSERRVVMGERTDAPAVLWAPDPDRLPATRISAFADLLADRTGRSFPTYADLWSYSTTEIGPFWAAVADSFGVRWHDHPTGDLADDRMPGARWFPGGTLNYAEHALAELPGRPDDAVAVIAATESGAETRLTVAQLRARVGAAQRGLQRAGVGAGDRVVALVPNGIHALVGFLATAALGAVWSSCSPDFGPGSVIDRFRQIEPKVLLAVDGYRYGGRDFDVTATVARLRDALPGLAAVVHIPVLGTPAPAGSVSWEELTSEAGSPVFTPVPFDAPLWVLYSSGTTGLPKPIVQSVGGILLEHLKAVGLQSDLGPGSVFFWFTTTGWMMWNFLVGGLLVGATVVVFDGNPGYPDLGALWRLAQRYRVTYFGTSAPFITACRKAGLTPGVDDDLTALEVVGSTGSPLDAEGFSWLHDEVGAGIQIVSLSGGTDLCTAIVGGAPTVPVWAGEISCRALGARVEAYSPTGEPLIGAVGELVLTAPMPSMPVAFWGDDDGSRLRDAYFAEYPGVWRHGDWIRITERGSCVIEGRSDATLNRGGVRMGTAEFYRVVEAVPEVRDALVVDTSGAREGELLLFVVLADGADLAGVTATLRRAIREDLSPRHVPSRVLAVPGHPADDERQEARGAGQADPGRCCGRGRGLPGRARGSGRVRRIPGGGPCRGRPRAGRRRRLIAAGRPAGVGADCGRTPGRRIMRGVRARPSCTCRHRPVSAVRRSSSLPGWTSQRIGVTMTRSGPPCRGDRRGAPSPPRRWSTR